MRRKHIYFDDDRAIQVFGMLQADWWATPKDSALLPHRRLPLLEPEARANLLFFYTMMNINRAFASQVAIRFLHLYEEHPWLVEPAAIVKRSEKRVKRLVASYCNAQQNTANSWWRNARVLTDEFSGSALNIAKGESDFAAVWLKFEQAKRQNHGITGLRMKSLTLFFSLLQEEGLIPVFSLPLIVDFYALRILWALELMDLREYQKPFVPNKPEQKKLRGKTHVKIWDTFIDQSALWSLSLFKNNSELDHIAVNRGMWNLSRLRCSRHLQNKFFGQHGRYFSPARLASGPKVWGADYHDVCRECRYNPFCLWAIPSRVFYRWSAILLRERRVKFPGK